MTLVHVSMQTFALTCANIKNVPSGYSWYADGTYDINSMFLLFLF